MYYIYHLWKTFYDSSPDFQGLLGVFFRIGSPALAEDIPIDETEWRHKYNYDFSYIVEKYNQNSTNCFVAAGAYVGVFAISFIMWRINKRSDYTMSWKTLRRSWCCNTECYLVVDIPFSYFFSSRCVNHQASVCQIICTICWLISVGSCFNVLVEFTKYSHDFTVVNTWVVQICKYILPLNIVCVDECMELSLLVQVCTCDWYHDM